MFDTNLLCLIFHSVSIERAMLHDENVYPEPFQFKPERFLTADGLNMKKVARDPDDIVWGFGRRFVHSHAY
jgi:cytochrome P450